MAIEIGRVHPESGVPENSRWSAQRHQRNRSQIASEFESVGMSPSLAASQTANLSRNLAIRMRAPFSVTPLGVTCVDWANSGGGALLATGYFLPAPPG